MIRIDEKFRLLRSDEKMNRFVFNRQGRGTYVVIQAGRLAEGQLSLDHGKDVERWTATLSRQQIVAAGIMVAAGVKGIFVDRLKTNDKGDRCAFSREIHLYGQGNRATPSWG